LLNDCTFYTLIILTLLLTGCAQQPVNNQATVHVQAGLGLLKRNASVFGPDNEFVGSPLADIGLGGLFPVHPADSTRIAILSNGDDSFAARIQALKQADTSIRIQALVFTGDEAGLYIAELLKQKKREGLDVRVIVDAFSNPGLQTQLMFFDLKQNDIEVEGYEAMLLQWINEVPVPHLMPHAEPDQMDKRFHEKMWLIDAETDHGMAIVGGLNVANEYFRVDPDNVDFFWRDQDVIVKGEVIKDMVTAFDRNIDYFLVIKKSRGIFNTDLYWDKTRKVLDVTGKIKFNFHTDPGLDKKVRQMAEKNLQLDYHSARVRFFQNRPRYKETYIGQAYLKLIMSAAREILMANAYFVPSETFISAIKDAARRCVRITLITNSTQTNDLPEITMVGRESYEDILSVNNETAVKHCFENHRFENHRFENHRFENHRFENQAAGIQIWEWQGKRSGTEERTEGTMHSKYAVFDSMISLVGSYNLDPRSEKLNSESALVFENEQLAETLAQLFHNNDLALSQQISMDQAKEYLHPTDPVYNIEKKLGDWFKDEF
jgi:putative cardiolipin synthase